MWPAVLIPSPEVISSGEVHCSFVESHCYVIVCLVQCCFASTETIGLLGTGAQDGRLVFHTAPDSACLWIYRRLLFNSLMIVSRLFIDLQETII